MEHILNLEQVKKYYGGNSGNITKAVDGISMYVDKGEFVAIMGASGSGKTTLLNCISTIDTVTSGHITVNNQDITKIKDKDFADFRRENLGFIFQDFNLLDTLTIEENISLSLVINKQNPADIDKRVHAIADKLGIRDILSKFPYEVSGGQKQRVAIARALSNNPKVLLSDEATSALDPDATESILKLLRDLNKRLGITIILITHEMSVIKSIANRVAVMENGKVVEEGDVYDIFANPKEEITKKFINSSSALSNITKLIENKTIIPADSKLVKLTFTRDSVGNATISKISREYNVDVNIMLANVDVVNADALGGIIASIEGTKENVQRAIDFLHESNVKVEVIHHA